jgi:hypothetical protein
MNFTQVTAVAFQEDGMWIAQCLEYNLVSCAESLQELPNELMGQILDQIAADRAAGREPFSHFKRAPQKYWDLFDGIQVKSQPIRPRRTNPRFDLQLFPLAEAA